MGKGYADGPVTEERMSDPGESTTREVGHAVFGSTDDDPASHFIGWREDVDPDQLFASGKAWGLSILEQARKPA
jgi:hypothetical protein